MKCREFLAAGTPTNQPGSEMLTAILAAETAANPNGSFPAIFSQALALGTLSRRRVFQEAGEKLASGRQRAKTPAAAAAATAESSDFHWHMAARDRQSSRQGRGSGLLPRHWRWRVQSSFFPVSSDDLLQCRAKLLNFMPAAVEIFSTDFWRGLLGSPYFHHLTWFVECLLDW